MQIRNADINQKNIHKKEPSFNARIYYVDSQTFSNILKRNPNCFQVGRISNTNWLVDEGAFKQPSAFTLKAYNCVVCSIFNPKTKLLNKYHLSPYPKTMLQLERVQGIIFEQAKALKGMSKIKLQGFITAGDSNKIASSNERGLLPAIQETFQKIQDVLGMDYSIIAGRIVDSGVSVISDARLNAHYVYTCPHINKREILANSYEINNISPKDTVVFV